MKKNLKLISWNVNGIRACIKKNCFFEFIEQENPDVLGIQEIKALRSDLAPHMTDLPNYHSSWHSADRKGYSGVATFTKPKPKTVIEGFGNKKYDTEGRVLISEYDEFFLLNCYFPNGQRDDERLQYKLDFYQDFFDYCEELKKEGKHLVICGDYNTAHTEIDLARPKQNEHTSGFMKVEREWIDRMIEQYGYIDTFRAFNKEPNQYSWWSYRARARTNNVGWRIDYFFVTKDCMPYVKNAFIRQSVMGSDHCPVGIELMLR
ncbi:MAG: exodeoxyribonuclease III [bacterium]